MKIELENCQKSLTLKDFEEVESKLGHVLPERLKEFYLQSLLSRKSGQVGL